ncbi:MAG: amidohydrolase family protein, partial [Cytophagaceae bacterium]
MVSRRTKFILAFLFLLLGCFAAIHLAIPKLGGNFEEAGSVRLSPAADSLLQKAYQGIDPSSLRDYHAHIAGIGTGNTGCYVNDKMTSPMHPLENLKFKIYQSAAGIKGKEADQEFLERLIALMKADPKHGKLCILAFDRNYNKDGTINEDKTEFYVPNDYVWSVCQQYPEFFIPCISVHPYRKDALQELEKWGKLGVKQLKWLPNAMGMDPSDNRCDSFYVLMKKYDITLLSHAGHEKAVHAEDDQRFGNPLLMRRPLDLGVKVIMAHCASLGENPDLDASDKKMTDNFEL